MRFVSSSRKTVSSLCRKKSISSCPILCPCTHMLPSIRRVNWKKIGGPTIGNYCLIINSSAGQTRCEKITPVIYQLFA